MIEREALVLSDGTRVTIRAPGIGFEIDAAREIPGYPAFRRRLDEGDASVYEERLPDCLTFSCLLIEHGAETPRFRREPRPGTPELAIGELCDPDFMEIATAIGKLLNARRRRGFDFYRPIWAARAASGSTLPQPLADASEPDLVKSSG